MYKRFTAFLLLTIGAGLGWLAHEYQDTHVQPYSLSNDAAVIAPLTFKQKRVIDTPSTKLNSSVTQLLEDNDYLLAIERYEFLQASADSQYIQQAKADILMHAQKLIKSQDFVPAVQLLQSFLIASYRDNEARLLLAEAFVGQQDYPAAINVLYEARGIAFRPQMLTHITHRIRQIANKQAELYRKTEDKMGLLTLYQNLTQKEPDYAAWFIELAAAQLALENREAAQHSLALVTSDPDVGEKAQVILLELQKTSNLSKQEDWTAQATDIVGIPLIQKGQSFLVEASLGNASTQQLLIDTGASMTVLNPDVLQQGVIYRDTGNSRVFNTANGAVRAPIYILDSLTVGDWTLQNVEVGVLELNGLDGLLGMNFLSHFRFFIDQHASVLRLSIN